jgi:Family of unknown function (DUF6526)
MPQSFENHAHRPVPTFVGTLFFLITFILLIGAWAFGWPTLFPAVLSLSFAVAVLLSLTRTYITKLQDRIILLEMKVRCAELLPAGQDARLGELTTAQVVALRFASDAELGALLDRAIREKLPPKEIKRAVKNWRADLLRT